MEMKARPMERGVGAAILAALIILIVGVIVSTQGQNLFRKYKDAVFYMENGQGVRKGTPVTVNGLPAGSVERVEPEVRDILEEQEGVTVRREVDHVKVTIRVFSPYHEYLREGSKVKVILPFIMGSTSIDLQPGPVGANPLPSGGLLERELVKGLGGKVEVFIDSGNKVLSEFEEISDKLKRSVANIEGITHRINYGRNTLGELLNDDKKMYNQIVTLLTDADTAANNINTLANDLHKITSDLPEILADVKTSVSKLRETSENTLDLSRQANRVPQDLNQVLTELRVSLAKLDAFTDDLRPFGTTLADFAEQDMPRLSQLISTTSDAAVLLEVASRELPPVMQRTKDSLAKMEAVMLSMKGTWPISGNLPPKGYQPKRILIADRGAAVPQEAGSSRKAGEE